jgi:outer membrane protein OmpA-like peptidoglycan-associated protein
MSTHEWEESHDEASTEEERRFEEALRQLAADTPVSPDFCARVLAATRQSSSTSAAAEHAAGPGAAGPRRRCRFPSRLSPAVSILAAGLCLSLAMHGWLTVRWQARQADLTRQLATLQAQVQREAQDSATLRHELTVMQTQVQEAQAESRAWQARQADLMRQLAALQAQVQPEAPSQRPVGYASPSAVPLVPGTDLRGRPYTTAELAQALFPESRAWRFREHASTPGPPASVVLPLTFAPASAAIEPQYVTDLDRLGMVLTQPHYATSRVWIVGHTDSLEAPGTETALAHQRAEAVQRYLVEHFAIAPERLLVHGEGASQPRAPNDTPEGRSANRRVEIVAVE